MKRSEYEKKMADLQNQIEELKKVDIEEDDKRWKPSLDEKYYFVTGSGQIHRETWFDTVTGNTRYAIGNCFKTEEEAKFAVEKLKVIAELSGFAEQDGAIWDGATKHYCIKYNVEKRNFVIDNNYIFKNATLYFESVEDAQEAIKKVGEERIKKYCLRIMEGEE